MLSYPPFVTNAKIRGAASNSPWMKRGDKGLGVALLQAALIDLGYPMPISLRANGLADGVYGSETHGVVLKFQTDQNLSGKDGIAGRETFARLDALMVAKYPSPKPKPKNPPPYKTDRNYMLGTADPTIKPDPGSGAWNTKPKTMTARIQKQAVLEILPPRGLSAHFIIGKDAAKHMKHYMDSTGANHTIDLEGMLREVPSAKQRFLEEVGQAWSFVESLPAGAHRITSRTAESCYNDKHESMNWYFAIGGYATWGKGTATVTDGAAGREYKLEFEYKFFDRYNWDKGKQVTIGPVTITDEFMGEFHRQGLAREYTNVGSIKRTFTWKQGEAIPGHQF